jgi:uncharacterized membrane protein YqgA involved in biofilm formation
MGGTILNIITVAIGSAIGLLIGHRLSPKIQESVVTGLGLMTLFVGLNNAGKTGNPIIPLLSIALGAIIGELLDIDGLLQRFAGWLQSRYAGQKSEPDVETRQAVADQQPDTPDSLDSRARFITGFVTASLVFCVGPLTFVGSIQDGMGLPIGFQQLAIKSVLDGFAAMAFAASFGIGVSFSIITILVLQGGLALLGSVLGEFMTVAMINEMTAVGGLILMGLALVLLDLKKPRMANFLPALVIAPLMVAIATAVGINLYPL